MTALQGKKWSLSKGNVLLLLALGVIVAAFVVSGAFSGTDRASGVGNAGRVSSAETLEFDWGNINIQGGKVRHTFTLQNGGSEDLILKGAFTSCGCTKATIALADGHVSPGFGMNVPNNWTRAVKPGERFTVTVEFDPLFHGPKDVGPITRAVYLVTSAPADGRVSRQMRSIESGTVTEMRVRGKVLSEDDFGKAGRDARYTNGIGDFRFPETEFDFGVIKQSGGIVRHEFPFLYAGDQPITITGTPTSCRCTEAHVTRKRLQPGDEGVLVVEFDPNLHEEPAGKFFRTIMLNTDPPQKERVQLTVWAEIDLDLGPGAYKLKGPHKD